MSDRGKEQLAKLETEEGEIKRLLLGIMEGYKDTVIPPLSYFSPSNAASEEMGSSSLKKQRSEASMAKTMFKERKRREQMSQKFAVLLSMLPSRCKEYKPSKEKIVSDTMNYIKHLEEEKERLEGLKNILWKEPKLEKPVLMKCPYQNSEKFTVSNGATFFAIQLPRRRGLLADIVKVFEKHKAEVLEARVCVDDQRLLTFTATIVLGNDGVRTIEKIRQEILCL